jgi:hypothetical protein
MELVEKERVVMGRRERGHGGSTSEENNGYVVFNEISTDQLGVERGGGRRYSAGPHPFLQQISNERFFLHYPWEGE